MKTSTKTLAAALVTCLFATCVSVGKANPWDPRSKKSIWQGAGKVVDPTNRNSGARAFGRAIDPTNRNSGTRFVIGVHQRVHQGVYNNVRNRMEPHRTITSRRGTYQRRQTTQRQQQGLQIDRERRAPSRYRFGALKNLNKSQYQFLNGIHQRLKRQK